MTTVIRRRHAYPLGEPNDSWTVGEARARLFENRFLGDRCPTCDTRSQVYARRINGDMAVALMQFYREYGCSPGHAPSTYYVSGNRSGDVCKLRFWGILKEEPGERLDGGRAGFWRVTDLGEQFVLGQRSVREIAFLYKNKFEGFGGGRVRIQDCLGKRFDYAELMTGAP